MVDPNFRGTIFPKCLSGFAKIADRCLRSVVKERPTMAEVVVSLQALLELQQRYENSAEPSGITRFINQSGTSSSKSPENNINQYNSTEKDASHRGEFMPNGNFKDLLHSGKQSGVAGLPLATKVKTEVGITRGNSFLRKPKDEVGEDRSRAGTLSESRLDKHKKLLDKDFIQELLGYEFGYSQNTCYSKYHDIGDYYPGSEQYFQACGKH